MSPYPEDDVEALIDRIGATRCCSAPTSPIPRALPTRLDFVRLIENRSEDEIRLVMRDNAEHLLVPPS